MRKLRLLSFLLSLVCWVITSRGQNPNPTLEVAKMQFQAKQVVPPAPEAAELGKYGNVPISLFTGTPTISIPLFELKGTSLSLPISMSYNASGFKPTDPATWVGSGWSLNAGGVVTRSVMGNPDNETNYFGVPNLLNPPNQLDVTPYYAYMQNIQAGIIETQPDVYYYNFAGHSGKFILRPDMTVAKKERDLSIITPCITGSCPSSKFTIVDEQGITYVFDQVETTLMQPYDGEGQPSYNTYNFVSSWYLSMMHSATSEDVIEFEYYTTTNGHVQYQNMLPNTSATFTYGCKRSESCNITYPIEQSNTSTVPPPLTTIKRKFLKKVTFKRFNTPVAYADIVSVTGSRDDSDFPEDRRVNQVKIYSVINSTDKLVKQYDLSYGYFDVNEPGQSDEFKKRLRLESMQEISTDINTASPPAYTFTYLSASAKRHTAELDHWGFYNASGNTTSLVPSITFTGQALQGGCYIGGRAVGGGANREPSLEGSSATLLNMIKYPTGGYTRFEYELNQAKFADNTAHPAGGVRIKKMVDYSFVNKQAVIKQYSYLKEDEATTSGVAGIWPEYRKNTSYRHYFQPFHSCQGCCDEEASASDHTTYTIAVTTNSIYGLGSFRGGHIGYTRVTESSVDSITGQPLGKTVYEYNMGQYFEYEEDIKSGDLVRQAVYRNDDKLLQETVSSYDYSLSYDLVAQLVKSYDQQDNKTGYCKVGTNNYSNYFIWNGADPACIPGTNAEYGTKMYVDNYSIMIQGRRLKEQTTRMYDQFSDGYITSTKKYTYGNAGHDYPTLTEEISTQGTKVFTSTKYVADYSNPPSPANGSIAAHIKDMKTWNMQALPVEKLQYRTDENGNNPKYISGQLTDYTAGKPTGVYFLEAQPPLTSVTVSAINTNTFVYDTHYRQAAMLGYGFLGFLTDQAKTDDIPKSYIWDYEYVYPIAEVTGAASYEIAYTSFETGYKGGFSFNGTPQSGTTVTGKRYYRMADGNITGNTNPAKAYTLSYWKNSNTGPYTVTGSTGYKTGITRNGWTCYEHTISSVSNITISGSSGDYIDELRLYPAAAQMATQTFEPLIGITSQCGINNQVVYYEYDGLNRLTTIRDDKGDIVKHFEYNYGLGTAPDVSAKTLYYNAAVQDTFQKTGCTDGRIGDDVIYKIPYGKHIAASQSEANDKAATDLASNGLPYANDNGQCRWWSPARHVKIFRNDCPPGQLGGFVWYDIPYGKYKSLVSQADADAQAQNDVNTTGQAYANQHASCQ